MRIDRDYFWFRLFKTRGIGPKRLASIARILEAEHPELHRVPLNPDKLAALSPKLEKILSGKIRAADKEKVHTEYAQLKGQGIDIIHPGHPDFPPHLLEISPVLFVKGQRKRLMSDSVAIVGARQVSDQGTRITKALAGKLAAVGIDVVSGYAQGVDSAAHLGALAAGGTTTIVLPYGIKELRQKQAFRKFNWDRDILAVSQFDPAVKWLARNAIIRNKLLCELSKAVVVIASGPERDAQGKSSGTFSTAKTALEIGRPLFVLAPSCLDNPPKGNAALIELGGYSFNPVDGIERIIETTS